MMYMANAGDVDASRLLPLLLLLLMMQLCGPDAHCIACDCVVRVCTH